MAKDQKKRIFIIHGWGGSPTREWFPWIKKELSRKGYSVYAPKMPNTAHPKIKPWVNYLSRLVETPDKDTFFIGHSIGGQTVLRYIQQIKPSQKVGGIILIASWINLRKASYETKDDELIARPWIKTPIDWKNVSKHTKNITAIFSDNDPYVPKSSAEVFKKKLGAKIVVDHNMGHYNQEYGVKRVPSLLKETLKMAKP